MLQVSVFIHCAALGSLRRAQILVYLRHFRAQLFHLPRALFRFQLKRPIFSFDCTDYLIMLRLQLLVTVLERLSIMLRFVEQFAQFEQLALMRRAGAVEGFNFGLGAGFKNTIS